MDLEENDFLDLLSADGEDGCVLSCELALTLPLFGTVALTGGLEPYDLLEFLSGGNIAAVADGSTASACQIESKQNISASACHSHI